MKNELEDLLKGILILDKSYLEALAKLDPDPKQEFIKELVKMFISLMPDQLASMRAALNSNNSIEAKNIAHRLKSSSANLGASRLAKACEFLEHLDPFCNPEQISHVFSQIEDEFARVRPLFSDILSEK